MNCLPLPRSSAGVPRKTISPGRSSAMAASAIAAPTPEAAIVLCPQPWPSPGRASYSARIPIRGPSPAPPPSRRPDGRGQPACRMDDVVAVASQDRRRSRPRRGAPRTPAPGRRGCDGTARGSRPGRPRWPRRDGPCRLRGAWPGEWRSTRAHDLLLGGGGPRGAKPRGAVSLACRPPARPQRSADRTASATTTIAMMNRAIGSSSRPCRRSTTRTATTIPTQAARRIARVQSPR